MRASDEWLNRPIELRDDQADRPKLSVIRPPGYQRPRTLARALAALAVGVARRRLAVAQVAEDAAEKAG